MFFNLLASYRGVFILNLLGKNLFHCFVKCFMTGTFRLLDLSKTRILDRI